MLTIAVVDAVTCIIAGLAIFATLGYLANNQGKAVEEVIKQGLLRGRVKFLLFICCILNIYSQTCFIDG